MEAAREYANKRWVFEGKYAGSVFRNRVNTLVWDNAFRTTDIVGASSQGRLDLYLDNSAHKLRFAGPVKIPQSTRLMASVAPDWMRQNDPFLPYSINTAIPTVPDSNSAILPVPSLPASSLNGSKQTLAMNYTLTSKAIRAVPPTLCYRIYGYNKNILRVIL